MRARDLVAEYPMVTLDSDALDAARLVAAQRQTGVLVLDAGGEPFAVLPASSLVALLASRVIDDPEPDGVFDQPCVCRTHRALAGRTVRDCLRHEKTLPSVADSEDTVLEIAALMARDRSRLVAVIEYPKGRAISGAGPRVLGVITDSRLLEQLLGRTRSTDPNGRSPSAPTT
ncbi:MULTISPECIES: CBS domain-containing protein [unclassified Embleya]|uniref:CBS domain-containing protein n=1 Tax=unclassified Embleya TaxID=2699296 RepID=UPI0033C40CC5